MSICPIPVLESSSQVNCKITLVSTGPTVHDYTVLTFFTERRLTIWQRVLWRFGMLRLLALRTSSVYLCCAQVLHHLFLF